MVSLAVSAIVFAMPAIMASLMTAHRHKPQSLDMYLFGTLFAALPLLAAILVGSFRRPWVAAFALPSTVLALALAYDMRDKIAVDFAVASLLVVVAMVRGIQHWRAR